MIESLNFSGNQFNFQKYTTRTIDSLRTPYDFRSMMHYGSTAFGGGRTTIQTIDSRNQKLLGQRGGFSSIDIQRFYNYTIKVYKIIGLYNLHGVYTYLDNALHSSLAIS